MKRRCSRQSPGVFDLGTLLLSQLSAILCFALISGSAPGAQVSVASREALENEAFIRFHIVREGDAGTAQSVEYFTQDDTAVAGVHYHPASGTARFAARENTAVVEVPLIDNAQVDGERVFRLVLANASAGLQIPHNPIPDPEWASEDCHLYNRGVIKDNEFRPTLLNTSFAPDLAGSSFAMPDGRYLVRDDSMLHSNGWVAASFVAGAGALDGSFTAVHVFPDGKILGYYQPTDPDRLWRLVRLFPNGAVDSSFPDVESNIGLRFLAAQTDGKILVRRSVGRYSQGFFMGWMDTLLRLNPDASPDATFLEAASDASIAQVRVQPDGKIFVAGNFERLNGRQCCGLIRLHADGSLDTTFSSPICRPHNVLFRRNGKILMEESPDPALGPIVQLDADGVPDPSFSVGPGIAGLYFWLEQSDGRILIGNWQPSRLNSDGSLDPTFAPLVEYPPKDWCGSEAGIGCGGPGFQEMPFGAVFSTSTCRGSLTAIDGFPCNSSGWFLDGVPRPDFRPFTPPACYRSADSALIQIVRTGDTTNAASVEFSTLDDTARSGIDFLLQSGTLTFAPREVSKTIAVPLFAKTQITNRLRFMVALSNPNDGYAVVDPIPVVIWPDLRLEPEQMLTDGKITLHGTIPGLRYILEWSTDLKMWRDGDRGKATTGTLELNVFPGVPSVEFYRARRAF